MHLIDLVENTRYDVYCGTGEAVDINEKRHASRV
jgi:hypothetical protein